VVEAKRWFAHEVTDLTALFDIFDPVSSHFVCVVSYEMRRGKILAQPRHVSLRKIRRLPPVLRRAVLRDWATFLHNVAWDSLRPELAVIEQVLAAEVELHV
jgi:hypothetical protein